MAGVKAIYWAVIGAYKPAVNSPSEMGNISFLHRNYNLPHQNPVFFPIFRVFWGRYRHAICGSPMIVIHRYIHTYTHRLATLPTIAPPPPHSKNRGDYWRHWPFFCKHYILTSEPSTSERNWDDLWHLQLRGPGSGAASGCRAGASPTGGGRSEGSWPPHFENRVDGPLREWSAQNPVFFSDFTVFWGRLATLPTIRTPTQKSVATPLWLTGTVFGWGEASGKWDVASDLGAAPTYEGGGAYGASAAGVG